MRHQKSGAPRQPPAQCLSERERATLAAVARAALPAGRIFAGAGQRATLSALVKDGMKAVTIRVNDVEGVGGFVLPGDRVDGVLTRQVDKTSASNEVVLQNGRVLAVDQQADERADKPSVDRIVWVFTA